MPATRRTRADGVEVVRSDRRRATVSAYRQDGRTVVLLPARMSAADEDLWVSAMLTRLAKREARRDPSDGDLADRAARLSALYLDDRARPTKVTWSPRQGARWGSCTPADRTIRLSTRLRGMPDWVIDYVLLHELAHLLQPGHDPAFWALVGRYPRTERARGFLEGVASSAELACSDE
ncbi:MAG TPA: M48 family metallopeptidase [Mycobacteriales bacterium]|nr:M48 family metallopeptidase [Mycobacteriales bacterium]